MFMYAHAYALSKKLNRELYIDNESAYLTKKKVGSYKLDRFNISSKIIEDIISSDSLSVIGASLNVSSFRTST